MSDFVKVALDAHGGDNAPKEVVKGALQAIIAYPELQVFLVGVEELINKELEGVEYENLKNYTIVVVNPDDGAIAFVSLASVAEADFNSEEGKVTVTLPFYGAYALMQVEA